MLKKALLVVAGALVVLAVVIATRPAEFRIERSLVVAAPPERIYPRIADFHGWDAWSPWAKLDPKMKTTFSGKDGEVGAGYAWAGDDKVGEGRMTLTEVAPPRRVAIRLEFLKPFASTNQAVFDLTGEQGGTRVAWIMTGRNDFVGKAFSLLMNMDKMVGSDFEKGLASLKAAAESGSP
jgi:uncharacterized protein YndB with AHSA1/START domain